MAQELVTMAERQWIAKYATIEMGNAIKQKIMDVDKVVARITEYRVL